MIGKLTTQYGHPVKHKQKFAKHDWRELGLPKIAIPTSYEHEIKFCRKIMLK
jgi:hypothetical protein